MIQTMDVHEDQHLDGLPNVPSSRYRNSDVHDANIEDGNPANWIGKDFDDQDYGEDSEEDYIEETPAWNVILSDESNQEEEPQEQQPSKKRKFATPQKRRQPKKPTQTKKPPPPQKRTQEKYPTKPKPKNKKKTQKELRDRINPTRRGEGRDNCIVPVWKYFEIEWIKEDNGIERKWAECNYCLHLLAADPNRNGTTSINKHFNGCKLNPDNIPKVVDDKQQKLSFTKAPNGEGHVYTWKHDDTRIQLALLGLFTIGELPFKFIENEAFIFVNALNGRVKLPSRHKISRDVVSFYLMERQKLYKHLSNPKTAIHLTTDTWTSSCQKINYMVVTAHFITEDFVMHKRVVNFREVDTHKAEDMARELLICINEWGMKNVMTMTVDNAKTNDAAINIIVKELPGIYENGKHFHIRCMAHIINLVVKMGLKHEVYHVKNLQDVVKYIRASPQRIKTFKQAMKDAAVESQRFLCGETPTRFELLRSAYDVKDAFLEYSHQDPMFQKTVGRVPSHSDFEMIKKMMEFLEKFKKKTEKVSCSTKPIFHTYTREILDIEQHLRKHETNPDFMFMVPDMKDKYDKYWGDYDTISDYVFFATLLDPQCKSKFMKVVFTQMLKAKNKDKKMSADEIESKARAKVIDIECKLDKFFKTYLERSNMTSSSQQETPEEVVNFDDENEFFGSYMTSGSFPSTSSESQLQRYLNEDPIGFDKGYDILTWWKNNAVRFPIVARMARDILGMQISTVASESTFSNGRRVITDYRTNLSVVIVEALICTQDWLRKSSLPIYDYDEVHDVLADDDLAIDIVDAIHNLKLTGKRSGN
ncbi:unnamed protein product [Lactuca saligna]|uniref:BED-type domain-containing protein n=2 Tax=Lactuca saligna TaxID=75948 RepID=A0AA36E0Z3_LACSI|nr:unnamed protein product [Lactuca saligna]